jgi:hypothetical protein
MAPPFNTPTDSAMDDQREPIPLQGLSLKAAQDASRKQILSDYERAGVDLPVVCLEAVLDRDIPDKEYGPSRSRKSSIVGPQLRSFTGRADADDVLEGSVDRIHRTTYEMSNGNPDFEPVRSQQKTSSRFQISDRNRGGNSTNSMKILGLVSPAESDIENILHPSDTVKSQGVSFQPVQAVPEDTAAGSTNPQDPNSSYESKNVSASDMGSATLGEPMAEPMGFHCHNFCCPPKNDTDMEKKYVVSSLQLPQGVEEEDSSYHSRFSGSKMIPGQGSLLDYDDAMTTSDSTIEKYRDDDVPTVEKGDGTALKHSHGRFRIAMVACCIIHLVLVGLIIGFAVRTDDDSEPLSVGSTSQGQAPQSAGTQYPGNTGTTTNTDGSHSSATATATPSVDGMTDTPTCIDSVELSLTCYGRESDILVYFKSCNPQPGDWVAIYDSSDDVTTLQEDDSVKWSFTCGNQVCTDTVSNEVVSVTDGFLTPVGTYRVHLIRDGPGPTYEAYASSVEFKVMDSLADCDVM